MTSNPNYWTVNDCNTHTSSSTTGYTNSFQTYSIGDTWNYRTWTDSTTSTSGTHVPYYYQYFQPYSPFIYSDEQRHNVETEQSKAECLKRENEEKERQEKLKIERENAEKKARELLLEFLSEKNKQRYLNKEPIVIESSLLNDISYFIPISYSRIKAINNTTKEVLSELCINVGKSDIPLEDNILTKLLHTMHDERNMLKTANHWNVKQNLVAQLN